MDIICKPVLGSVDNNFGVTPQYDDFAVHSKVVIASKPWWFIRRPVLRRVARFGLFVDPIKDLSFPIIEPRVIVEIKDPEAQQVKLIRPRYDVSVNSMGGQLLMIQTHGCQLFSTYGVFLGVVEVQYEFLYRLRRVLISVLVQDDVDVGGELHAAITIS